MTTATRTEITRAGAIKAIRAALKRRSGKAWSVTGGRGTAWGWLAIASPPARRTWSHRLPDGTADLPGNYVEYDSGMPGHNMSPAERRELGALLGLGEPVHIQGVSIPASRDYWQEYIDRAEGRTPSVIGKQYWD